MGAYPLRPYVHMDDDGSQVLIGGLVVTIVNHVSYAIHSNAGHWFTDMIMSPGHWPSTNEKDDG